MRRLQRKHRIFLVLFVILGSGIAALYTPEMDISEIEKIYLTPESEYIEVQNEKLHVRIRGNGTPIMLIHGSFSSLHTWQEWENRLCKSYRTISMDLPGHGLTGPSVADKYTMDDYAVLLFALADTLKLDSFYVAGNSMGGGVCWKMAIQQPSRIRGMILIDAVGANRSSRNEKPFIFKMLENKALAKLFTRFTPRFFFRMNMKQVFYDENKITRELTMRYYHLMRREGNREATIKRLSQTGKDNGAEISGIHCPTLILWGRHDRWVPVSTGEELHAMIKNSELVVFENAGHVPMEEIPETSLQPVLQFLKNQN
jgi:pimeloyl-ACP methyl ester carboxylesterase